MADKTLTDDGHGRRLVDLGDGAFTPPDAGAASEQTLRASSAVVTAGTVTETAVTSLGAYRRAEILCNLTAAATEAGDTFDVYVDTSMDGGTTWINVVHFPQMVGNGGAKKFVAVIAPSGAPVLTTTDVTADAAVGVVRQLLGDRLRVRHVAVDVATLSNMSFTFSVKARLQT